MNFDIRLFRAKAVTPELRRSGGGRVKYVYILQSLVDEKHRYTGVTDDIKHRLSKHNAGEVSHTRKHKPWRLQTYLAFSDPTRAHEFEQYLKSGSGRAFAKKRL